MSPANNLRTLENIVEQRTEKVASRKNPAFRYIGLEHIAQGSPRLLGSLPGDASTSVNSIFRKGDILFGKLRPNLRKTWQALFDGYCSTDILVLRPRAGIAGRYAAHLFQFEPIFLEAARTAEGTKMPRTSWEKLKKFSVFCPDDLEQQQIGEILDTIGDAIQAAEELVAKLRMIKQGLLQDLLTRGVDEHGALRDFTRNPDRFHDSSLGKIPIGWNVEALGANCQRHGGSIQTGPFGSQLHAEDYVDDGVPIITVEHLGDNKIFHTNLPRVGASDYLRLRRYTLETGDLAFSRVGAIDRCAFVSEAEHGWLFSGRLLRVRPGTGGTNPRFLSYQLNSEIQRRWILNHAVGSTMACLNTSILSGVPIAVPQPEEQNRIADVLFAADRRIDAEVALLEKLQQLKLGLSSDLLAGRVRVKTAEKMVS